MKRPLPIYIIFLIVGEIFAAANPREPLTRILVPVDGLP
jgi:hypothetical protein